MDLSKVGDLVSEGQKIGDSSKFISAPVHASISGKVAKIDRMPHPCGVDVNSVVIDAQSAEEQRRPEKNRKSIEEEIKQSVGGLSLEELEIIREQIKDKKE